MKEELSINQLQMLDVPDLLVYAAPILITLMILEWVFSYRHHHEKYNPKDTLAATVIGLGNVGISLMLKTVTIGIALFWYNLVPWSIPQSIYTFLLCLIWLDFWRYVSHRISHECRLFWATHVTHHSSEKYNWSVAFRLGWTQYTKILFFIPVIVAGFHPIDILIAHQIAVLYQFWIHTEYIKKLPKVVEYILVTPSHHRVHHGCNPRYLDKNYGSTLIIWDRMFGTFQEEDEPVTYGLTQPVHSYNPIYLCFHEWLSIFKDVRNANSLKGIIVTLFGKPKPK